MIQDVRWKQRYENFDKAFKLLGSTLKISSPSLVEKAGAIQFFEVTFELSWKLLKDYLEHEGYEVKSPREAIKTGFSYGLIVDGEAWLQALTDRNLTVHTYDEAFAEKVFQKIRHEYFILLSKLHAEFEQRLCLD